MIEIGKHKIEIMDLYKDETGFAVKTGESSSKLCYAVDQSISALKAYRHKKIENAREIKNFGIWIVLKRNNFLNEDNGKPDFSELNMIMLKNKLDAWKKEVRVSGYTPIIYLNYWN